jgi:hypothetical protein
LDFSQLLVGLDWDLFFSLEHTHIERWLSSNWKEVNSLIVDTVVPKYNGGFDKKKTLTWNDLLDFEEETKDHGVVINTKNSAGPRISSAALSKLFEEKKSIAEIAKITGYRYQTVISKLRAAGIRFAPRELKVTDDVLGKLVDENKTVAQIATATKMSDSGIRVRLKKLGLQAKRGNRSQGDSDKIYGIVARMKTEGYKTVDIAQKLSLSSAAIIWRIQMLQKKGIL